MPKADRPERPTKRRKKTKYRSNTGYGSYYRLLFFEQDLKCGLTGTAMNETDSIYYKDNMLALEASVIAEFGSTAGWILVDVQEPERTENIVEEYDHYEAWNPTVS